MMLRPSMYDIIKENQCYYSFVIAISKRAQKIVNEYIFKHEILEDNPVDIAVKEFADKKYTFLELNYEED